MIHMNSMLYMIQSQAIVKEDFATYLKVVLAPLPEIPTGSKWAGFGVAGAGLWPMLREGENGCKILMLRLQGEMSCLARVMIGVHHRWMSDDGNTIEDYYQQFTILNSV